MYNIAYYEKHITRLNTKPYYIYEDISRRLQSNIMIFCDACDIILPNNVPIFHSFYLRQLYNLTYIITDKYNLDSLDKIVNAKIVVVYDDSMDAVVPTDKSLLLYNSNTDLHSFIQENIYEV